jgi:hypothetical protein
MCIGTGHLSSKCKLNYLALWHVVAKLSKKPVLLPDASVQIRTKLTFGHSTQINLDIDMCPETESIPQVCFVVVDPEL